MSETATNIALLVFAGIAIWGAADYIVESVKIFSRALKRHRERKRD